MTEKFEAVVVGAGPAGLAAAYELARNGVQTLVLERGKAPGTKSMTGGILYGQTNTPYNLDYLFPDFETEAPLERPVNGYRMHAVHEDKVKEIDLTRLHHHEHKWSYAVLRARFDKWFGDEVHKAAEESGGGLLTDVRVTGPLVDGGRIVGVKSNELDDIRADLVVAADGATSELVRGAGLRDWYETGEWFQGVKATVRMDPARMEERFGLSGENDGVAHLFAGSLFGGVRGGGFLYTNKDTLSIGTVFHLDSMAEERIEPSALLNRLLAHPLVANWLGDDYEELEYAGKLIPDGKKAILKEPHRDNLLAVGDASGQMAAQGPVIKGMNLGISAGIMAARSYLDAKAAGRPHQAGTRYAQALRESYVYKDTRPLRYRFMSALFEGPVTDRLLQWGASTGMGRAMLRNEKRVQDMMSSPFWAGAMPDLKFGYVTLPEIVAEELGHEVERRAKVTPKDLDDRIADLTYDTDIGRPHIVLQDSSVAASGDAVYLCPVSSPKTTRGCYSFVNVKTPEGKEKRLVALDTQPCIECGTCAVVADTKWTHPNGGKGVQYKYG